MTYLKEISVATSEHCLEGDMRAIAYTLNAQRSDVDGDADFSGPSGREPIHCKRQLDTACGRVEDGEVCRIMFNGDEHGRCSD